MFDLNVVSDIKKVSIKFGDSNEIAVFKDGGIYSVAALGDMTRKGVKIDGWGKATENKDEVELLIKEALTYF